MDKEAEASQSEVAPLTSDEDDSSKSRSSTPPLEQDDLHFLAGTAAAKTRFSFDALIIQLGEFGLYQKLIFFLLWIPAAASSVGIYASIFLEFTPEHRCRLPASCGQGEPDWLRGLEDPHCTMPAALLNETTAVSYTHLTLPTTPYV